MKLATMQQYLVLHVYLLMFELSGLIDKSHVLIGKV